MGTQVEIICTTKDYFWACLNMRPATKCISKREIQALNHGILGKLIFRHTKTANG